MAFHQGLLPLTIKADDITFADRVFHVSRKPLMDVTHTIPYTSICYLMYDNETHMLRIIMSGANDIVCNDPNKAIYTIFLTKI